MKPRAEKYGQTILLHPVSRFLIMFYIFKLRIYVEACQFDICVMMEKHENIDTTMIR